MKRGLKKLFFSNKNKVVIYILTVLFFVISFLLFMISVLKLNGIETVVRIIVLFMLCVFMILLIYKGYIYILKRRKVKYFILIFLSLIASIILLIITYFINTLYGGIGNLTLQENGYYTGYLISLNDNNKLKKIGMISDKNDNEGFVIANEIIKDKKIKSEIINYDSYEDMMYDLYKGILDGIFVQSTYISYFKDEYENIENDTKIVYKKTSKLENKNNILASNKNLTEPFTVLLMGVDSTENSINTNTSFNGDTLMLITFNPKTLNATIFSIPRDLYVPITCKNDKKAKINSSSVGGVSCVINTIKNLIDIDIDYYVKINFKGVVDLVDALDGIEVTVGKAFCEQDSNRDFSNQICLKEGKQILDGEKALAFARHRHSYITGDLTRIQNQQLIVEALAKKMLSLNTITDFSDIMSAISNNIVTNMSIDQILSSYNILKNMVINVISDKEALIIEKAYLEVYDMSVFNEKYNNYRLVLGYYEKSLEDIIKNMKINLELENPELIKDFSFDANTLYEQKIAGKGIKNNVNTIYVNNFIGLSVSEVENWGIKNKINIIKEFVTSDNKFYNNDVLIGQVANQNVKKGNYTDLKSITIYINSIS